MTIDATSLWYVREGTGEPVGPVTAALLVAGIRAGRIPFTSEVCPVGASAWAALASYEMFAQVIHEVAPPPPAPAAPGPPAWQTGSAARATAPGRSALWYVVVILGSISGGVLVVVLLVVVLSSALVVKTQMDDQRDLEHQLNTLNSDKEDLDRKLMTAKTPEERASIEQQIADKEAAMLALKSKGTARRR